MIKKLVVLATAALLAGCVTAVDKFETEMPVGSVVSGNISSEQGEIYLPPGNWTVMGKTIDRNNSYQAFGSVVLGRIGQDNKLDGLVFYSTALETGMRYGFIATGSCDAEQGDLYHEKSSNQEFGNQGCVRVQELDTDFAAAKQAHFSQTESYLTTHNIKRPETMLYSFYRVVRKNKFLNVAYGFDFRQSAQEMLPDFEPKEAFTYDRQFGTELWKSNLETVISWSKEKEDLIRATYLD
ncbi:MAG: hypothetical protein ACMZ66_10665 [Thalassospira sp.]|uniref:hypothetical protein n=1 Tax=Thalassospira sp. TaxID=1912094 RepID=UPI003A83514E